MSVELERFSISHKERRAPELRAFALSQYEWLELVFPTIRQEYGTSPSRALRTYEHKSASHVKISLSILDGSELAGIAEFRPKQTLVTVVDGQPRSARGTEITYSLAREASLEQHKIVGQKLIALAGEVAPTRLTYRTTEVSGIHNSFGKDDSHDALVNQVMTAAQPDIENQPYGLIGEGGLEAIGGPNWLLTPGQGRLELAHGGKIMQLFYKELPLEQ